MNPIPTPSAKQIVSGLTLMTIFTLLWTGIAYYGFGSSPYKWVLGLFMVACSAFVYSIFKIRKTARHLPASAPEGDPEVLKKKEKWFMIVCAAEGVGIFLAINIVVNLHHPELQIPAMALVVGLHFFPLARIFDRKIDLYLGTWSTLIAVAAIVLDLDHLLSKMPVIVFTGMGLAAATTVYGLNMMLKARRTLII